MELEFKKVNSGEKPRGFEIGETTIYYRKNIEEKQKILEDGTTVTYWEYDEAEKPKYERGDI